MEDWTFSLRPKKQDQTLKMNIALESKTPKNIETPQ
jgi:hypothetical protein